jgi:hypothetical protein
MQMEQTACSETWAWKIQMPGNHTKERIQHSEHSKSLKSGIYTLTFTFIFGTIHKEVKYLIRLNNYLSPTNALILILFDLKY